MEIEQIEQRLAWLEEERRKDKAQISLLENRIVQMESDLAKARKEIGAVQDAAAKWKLVNTRIDQLDTQITRVGHDLSRLSEAMQNNRVEVETGVLKKLGQEMEANSKAIQDIRKAFLGLQDYKKLQKQQDNELGLLNQRLTQMDQKLADNQLAFDRYQQAIKLQEEIRKQDTKRVTDIQGEVTAYRKRLDDLRAKLEVVAEGLRTTDTRQNEVIATETERRQNQVAFMEKFNQQQVERDRTWREWQGLIDQVIKNGSTIAEQFQNLEDTLRSVRRAREQLEAGNQKIDRRINEVTEMHRLNEEHFRQEWNNFKADDQKRWSNYSLILDEHQNEQDRKGDRADKRLLHLEDLSQELNDRLTGIQNEEEKKLQQMVTLAHEWLATYERLLGKNSDLI
jgi:chromosome segregation ATPase